MQCQFKAQSESECQEWVQSIEEASKGFSRSASGNHLVAMAGAAGAGVAEEEVETYDDEEELELEEENLYQELNEEEQRPVVAPPRDKVGKPFKNKIPKVIFILFSSRLLFPEASEEEQVGRLRQPQQQFAGGGGSGGRRLGRRRL